MQIFDDFCKSLNKELQRANFGFSYNRVHLFYRSQVRCIPCKSCPNTRNRPYRWCNGAGGISYENHTIYVSYEQ